MERRADEAERELVQWKKVRFMADKVGDVFDGYITGVAPFGLFVELIEHYVEGLVHVSTLADDYYRYSEQTHTLFGENTRKTYRLGDKVVGAGGARRPRAPPDRSRARGRARRPSATTSGGAARAQPGAAEEGAAQRDAGAAADDQGGGASGRSSGPGRRERAARKGQR